MCFEREGKVRSHRAPTLDDGAKFLLSHTDGVREEIDRKLASFKFFCKGLTRMDRLVGPNLVEVLVVIVIAYLFNPNSCRVRHREDQPPTSVGTLRADPTVPP